MKKIFLGILVLVLTLVIAGCTDKKYTDDTINIVFFTDANKGGSIVHPYLEVEPNTLIEEPEDPVRIGFEFSGWFSDLGRTTPWNFDTDMVGDVSIMLYAKWTAIVSVINYEVNGGIMPNTSYPVEYIPGQNSVLPIPTRTGFTFLAWYLYDWDEENPNTKPGDSGYQTIPAGSFGELNLYAHWKAIEVVVTFRVNFPVSGQGPTTPPNDYLKYGAEIDFTTFGDTNGYRFMGWNSNSTGTGTWYVNGEVSTRTQRTTVYAIWEQIV